MQTCTVSEYVKCYLEEVEPLLKSYYSVQSVLDFFVRKHGAKTLIDLTGPDIFSYVQSRIKAGIKPNTVNRELSVISAAINHAIRKHGAQMLNPVRYQWLKPDPLRVRYLQRHEAQTLLTHAGQCRHDLEHFIRLALNTGCRKTELLTLTWSDVDIQKRYICIQAKHSKSNKPRTLPLNRQAMQAIENLKQNNITEWVFQRNGKRVKTYNWLFRKAVKQAGIEDFRIHDLRHTFASWLVSEGVELVKVRDLLGHSSIKMTERYAHLMPDRLRGAVETLDLFQGG